MPCAKPAHCALSLQEMTCSMKLARWVVTGRYTVVLNGYDVLQEALVKQGTDFAGRWVLYAERTIWNTDHRDL